MKKSIWALGLGCLVLAMVVNVTWAKTTDIPDVNGTYDVPGHPQVKVRVFVHNPKPNNKPQTTCNLTDPDSSSVVDPAGWTLPSNWKYYLNTNSAPSGVNLSTIASTAFGYWSAAANNKVAFSSGGTTSINKKALDGKNIIAWGAAPGSALAITYTWFQNGKAIETDTIMNKKFAWSWDTSPKTVCPNPNAYDAQDILTHELGHWVGLDDEYASTYAYNTMYGYGSKGEVFKDTLATGDKAGAANIY